MMERIYFWKKGGIENDGENVFFKKEGIENGENIFFEKRRYRKWWREYIKKRGIENDGENI